jgi:hypothetical protein
MVPVTMPPISPVQQELPYLILQDLVEDLLHGVVTD